DSTKPVPVTSEESRAFTLHSLKVCLLAAGAQVRATEEVSSFGEGVSRFVYSTEADIESYVLADSPEPIQAPQTDLQPQPTGTPIPADDTEALLVQKFANQAHSSSESEDEQEGARKSGVSTFSLFRNGPWGVIHACRQGDER
ncbi:unnamed protein product, partial [Symbiodinium necroappetens]